MPNIKTEFAIFLWNIKQILVNKADDQSTITTSTCVANDLRYKRHFLFLHLNVDQFVLKLCCMWETKKSVKNLLCGNFQLQFTFCRVLNIWRKRDKTSVHYNNWKKTDDKLIIVKKSNIPILTNFILKYLCPL